MDDEKQQHEEEFLEGNVKKECFAFPTFLPSNSCDPCANTLSTLAGSANDTKPNPLQR